MEDAAKLLQDPEFQGLLQRRSRWRWGLSGLLIVAYVVWGIGGIYFPEAYAQKFMGTSVPRGIAFGYLIIAASIILSLVYVRVINRLEQGAKGGER